MSAVSFSKCLRYSSWVVAPIQRISPRAKAGFSKFAASIEPSALPAPTTLCISSIKAITLPASVISCNKRLNRSSNSPRNLAPAINNPMSTAKTEQSIKSLGTSPATIRCAKPSTMAVLPTPGSPIIIGLFLMRRHKT